jgi:hypothetical protein
VGVFVALVSRGVPGGRSGLRAARRHPDRAGYFYPSREVFRSAEPFEVVVSAVGRSNGQPGASHDLLACVQGVLAVDPRHRHA